MTTAGGHLEVFSPSGLGEVRAGDDLAGVVADLFPDLLDGDVVVVTSKVVSKAEGRVRVGGREEAIDEETVRVVARRGPTRIVRNRLGLTMAAAGVDASNVTAGSVVLLPEDPDASARELRTRLRTRTGRNVAVVVTDTAGRAWRHGQTDMAVGTAGLRVAEDFNGRTDAYGNPLAVTLTAVADEIASAAELSQGKLTARPVAVVRGRPDLVLLPGEHGPGARSLVREEGADLFGYGAREAVVRAVAGEAQDRAPFGTPVDLEELLDVLARALPGSAPRATTTPGSEDVEVHLTPTRGPGALAAVLFAHGWLLVPPRSGESADLNGPVRVRPVGT